MTQEQLANYLGVSAPAVNKWENGISYPDITLLPPLARILKTDVNTLLSFHEELTPLELNQLLTDLIMKLKEDGYDAGFQYGEATILEYPTCDQLILSITQLLFGYLALLGVKNRDAYEQKIIHWYELMIDSKNAEVRNAASGSLCQFYMERNDFEKAQQLIDSIPPLGYDKRPIQAMLHVKQGNTDAAYTVYENMLYETANKTYSAILCNLQIACEQKQYDKAAVFTKLAIEAAKLFELGSYMIYTPALLLAAAKKEKEETLDALEQLIDNWALPCDTTSSQLYQHISFTHGGSEEINLALKEGIKSTDHDLDFIREDERFQKLIKRLD